MTLDDRITGLLAEYRIPGAAFGIWHDGEQTELAYGVRNVDTGEPVTTGTVFQLGSMTKAWTALAFLQLVDEGRADLDEPVFRGNVTPRHLLQHTHGVEESYGDPGEGDDVYERMVANAAGVPQVFPVGHTHGYSEALGYAVLARILEQADGKRWDEVMRDRLFDPMGLTATTARYDQVDAGVEATGHLIRSLAEGPVVTPMKYLPRAYGPAGTMSSTVGEVLALGHVLLHEGVAPNGKRVLSAERLHEMTHSRVPMPDPYALGPEWGLGLIVCDWHGETVYAADGSTIGQHSRLRVLPGSNTVITMLMNGGHRESFYRKVFTEILASLGLPPVPELPTPNPALRLDPSRYVGAYERADGGRFEVSTRDGKLCLTMVLAPLHAEVLGQPERVDYDLLPVTETNFLIPPTDPLEDTQTAAFVDFSDGRARYLNANVRVYPRVP